MMREKNENMRIKLFLLLITVAIIITMTIACSTKVKCQSDEDIVIVKVNYTGPYYQKWIYDWEYHYFNLPDGVINFSKFLENPNSFYITDIYGNPLWYWISWSTSTSTVYVNVQFPAQYYPYSNDPLYIIVHYGGENPYSNYKVGLYANPRLFATSYWHLTYTVESGHTLVEYLEYQNNAGPDPNNNNLLIIPPGGKVILKRPLFLYSQSNYLIEGGEGIEVIFHYRIDNASTTYEELIIRIVELDTGHIVECHYVVGSGILTIYEDGSLMASTSPNGYVQNEGRLDVVMFEDYVYFYLRPPPGAGWSPYLSLSSALTNVYHKVNVEIETTSGLTVSSDFILINHAYRYFTPRKWYYLKAYNETGFIMFYDNGTFAEFSSVIAPEDLKVVCANDTAVDAPNLKIEAVSDYYTIYTDYGGLQVMRQIHSSDVDTAICVPNLKEKATIAVTISIEGKTPSEKVEIRTWWGGLCYSTYEKYFTFYAVPGLKYQIYVNGRVEKEFIADPAITLITIYHFNIIVPPSLFRLSASYNSSSSKLTVHLLTDRSGSVEVKIYELYPNGTVKQELLSDIVNVTANVEFTKSYAIATNEAQLLVQAIHSSGVGSMQYVKIEEPSKVHGFFAIKYFGLPFNIMTLFFLIVIFTILGVAVALNAPYVLAAATFIVIVFVYLGYIQIPNIVIWILIIMSIVSFAVARKRD